MDGTHRMMLAATALAAMAAAPLSPAGAQNTVTVVPSTAAPVAVVPQGAQVIMAPTAPPPPQVEVIPAPPPTSATMVTWQPGHWNYNGATWVWVPGQYVARPQVTAVWVPGQWVHQPNGEYTWNPGHWS